MLSLVVFATRGHAQSIWDGGGATGAWSETANWGAVTPLSGGTQALQFGGTLQLAANNDLTTFTASSITFNAGAGAFTLSGNAISLAGGITNSSANLQTINLGMTLTADTALRSGTAGLTIGGAIDGAFGISKPALDTGTLTLNGANSYTGLTTVTAGTLVVGNALALGDAAQGTTVVSGGTMILAGGVTVTGETLTINGSGDASNTGALRAAAGDATWAGNVILGSGQGGGTTGAARLGATGAGNLIISGNISDGGNNFDLAIRSTNGVAGKIILSGTGSSYRDTYVVVGTLQLGATNALPTGRTLNMGNASNQGNAVFEMDGFSQTLGGLAMTPGSPNTMQIRIQNSNATLSTLTLTNTSGNTFGGAINGNIALVKNGVGNLTLSDAGGNATNSYTGLTSINAGSITITKATGLGTTAAGTTVADGAALILGAGLTVGGETLSITGTGVGSNGAFRAQTGTSSWAGAITLTGNAEIQADSGAALTIDVSSGSAITGTFNLTVDAAGDLTIADPIATSTGTLIKNGVGNLTLSGGSANTYTGSTTVAAGTLILSKTSGNAIASTAITVGNNSGGIDTLRQTGSNQIIDTAVLTFQGSGATAGVWQLNGQSETVAAIVSSGGAGIIENEGGVASTLTVNSATNQTFSGIIRDGDGVGTDGSLSLTKNGNNIVTLSGSNDYSGVTTVNGTSGSTLRVFNNTALGRGDGTTATGTVVNSGARVELDTGITVTNEAITINGTGSDNFGALRAINGGTSIWSGPVILGSGTGSGGTRIGTVGAGSVLNISGTITDNGSGFDLAIRTDDSPGKVIISGSGNSYRDTYIVVGTVQLAGGDDRLPTGGVVNLGNASTTPAAALDLNGFNQRIAGLLSTGTTTARQVINSSGTSSTLTIQNAAASTYTGEISGDISIVKQGTFTQTLSGTNTYTGRTIVQAGTLTLSGTGTIASSRWIDVGSGSTLSVSGLTGGGLTYAPTSGVHPISGSGSITGNLTVGGVGFISPGTTSDLTDVSKAGDGTGTLAISGGLTFNPAAASTVGTFSLFGGGVSDKITVGGALTLNNNSRFGVVFDPSYQQAWGDVWTLIDWATTLNLNGFNVNSESNLDLPDLDNGWVWQISNFSGSGALTIGIVPEPSRALLLLTGMAGMVFRRRRVTPKS